MHQRVEKSGTPSSTHVSPAASPKLSLGVSAKVWFQPLNGRCVQLVAPKKPKEDLVLLGIVRSDSGLELAIHTHTCDPEESSAKEDKNMCRETEPAKGRPQPLNATSERCENRTHTTGVLSTSQDNLSSNQTTVMSNTAPDVAQPTFQASNNTAVQKGRKRKRSHQAVTSRRSSRLASKKQKVENISSTDTISSLESKKLVTDKTDENGPCQSETSTVGINSSDPAEQALKQHVGTFVQSLGKRERFSLHKLPEVCWSVNLCTQ